MASSTPLRQPSPVERHVGGSPIRERRCCRRSSQWSHHQTRPSVLGMFSTFPHFILAYLSRLSLVALLVIFFSVGMLKLETWLYCEQRTKLSCKKRKLKVESGVKSCQHVTS